MRGSWVKTLFSIIAVVAIFTCIAITNEKPRKVTLIESIFTDIISLPQRGYTYAKAYLTANDGFFADIEELKKENEELQKRVDELETKLIDYDEIYAENQTLKSHEGLSSEYSDYSVVVADIISSAATNWDKTYILNKGEKDGVVAGMTVLAEDGLVGYIESVTKNTAKVVSILDAGNSVSARITRTRDELVCKGTIALSSEQKLSLQNIPTDTTVIVGDKIETSGLGGIYPKGISIGKVIEVQNKKNPIESEAIVETNVDFNKLETVAVIVEVIDNE